MGRRLLTKCKIYIADAGFPRWGLRFAISLSLGHVLHSWSRCGSLASTGIATGTLGTAFVSAYGCSGVIGSAT